MINNALKMAGEPSLVLGIFCAANGVWPILNISDNVLDDDELMIWGVVSHSLHHHSTHA